MGVLTFSTVATTSAGATTTDKAFCNLVSKAPATPPPPSLATATASQLTMYVTDYESDVTWFKKLYALAPIVTMPSALKQGLYAVVDNLTFVVSNVSNVLTAVTRFSQKN